MANPQREEGLHVTSSAYTETIIYLPPPITTAGNGKEAELETDLQQSAGNSQLTS